ncbi:response regulator transcription factor [Pseudomonas sp. NFR16]|uniref:response regulator transcription factor n=1 Tax=Pseudomonas sp. NFR16 TaxID=1566248 RepID=UPI0008AFC984|nr:response regulator [Pseudomonas sp. NFR16]SEJ94676.1 Response regulator receiver domain-containing protein [Pseudomonas sp. NFR16]
MARNAIISIIDNEDSIRSSVGSLIRSAGFSVDLFCSAESFVYSTNFSETVCLIVDIQMPGMSGLELQSLLVKSGIKIPIIFITGFADPSIRKRAMDGGAVCILDKPFQSDNLIKCVERALNASVDAM